MSRKEEYQSGEDNAPTDETWQERQKRRENEYFEYEEKYRGSDFGRGNNSLKDVGMDEHHNMSHTNYGKHNRDEYVIEDMDVMDAIATGQGYLDATNDLDRDYDGIPNRLDMDADGDSELDFEMGSNDGEGFIELDFDSIMGTEAPVKEPGTKDPTTKPGKGTDWDKIKRPQVNPNPKARRDRGDRPKPPRRSFRRKGMFR